MRCCDGPFIQDPEKGDVFEGITDFLTIVKTVADLVSPHI